jgi:polyisoprenoid-binding protein YceI
MTTQCFRWTFICLLVVLILAIGLLDFLIWNQRVDQEPGVADESFSQAGEGKDFRQSPKLSSEEAEKPNDEKAKANRAESGTTYQVDTKASRVYVKVGSATRIGHPHGVEGKLKSGKITLGATGELVFDMGSFEADTKEARRKVGLEKKKVSENEAKKVNAAMRSEDVLDVEKFPTAIYKITILMPAEKQEAGAPGIYEINGRFTLHGAEQPLRFKAKLERTDKQGTLKLTGKFAIKQSDYGVTPYSAAAGLVKVANRLQIFGELWLRAAR